MGVARIF